MYICKITDAKFLMEISEEAKIVLQKLARKDEDYLMDDDELDDLQAEITFAIVSKGMDNQDTVNEIGIRLYAIYDDILWQIREQRKTSLRQH